MYLISNKYIGLLIVVLLLIFASCSHKTTNNLKQTDLKFIDTVSIFPKGKSLIYKTGIDFGKKHFSGITIIKKTDSISNVVFINELGMKMFNFSFNSATGDFSVKYILEVLNRKILIKTLENDYRILLQIFEQNTKTKIFSSDNNKHLIKKVKYRKNIYYRYDTESKKINFISEKNSFYNILKIYLSYKKQVPETIHLQHKYKLSVKLNLIQN